MPKSIYYLLILLLFTIIYSEQTNAFPNSLESDRSIKKSDKQKNNHSVYKKILELIDTLLNKLRQEWQALKRK